MKTHELQQDSYEYIKTDALRRLLGGIGRDTVRRYVLAGLIPAPIKLAGINLWNRREVELAIENRKAGGE